MAVVIPIEKDDQLAMVAVAVIFGGTSTAAVALRILVAMRIARRSLDASDICIIIAWLLTMGLMITCISGTKDFLSRAVVPKPWKELTLEIEAVLGGFGWHYNEIVAAYGADPIVQYHKVSVTIVEVSWPNETG